MNYAQLVAFADNLTAACPVDKDGNTSHAVIRHAIMEHPHFFPYLNPRTELQAEEAECVSMSLDKAGVPTEEDGKPLSLWGRVLHFAGKANEKSEIRRIGVGCRSRQTVPAWADDRNL